MEDIERLNALSGLIIGAAINVHKALGPGLLESAYHYCLQHELFRNGIAAEAEQLINFHAMPLWKGVSRVANADFTGGG